MINHNDKIKELISSYIDGFVTEEEKKQVEDLILNSKEWQDYYKELRQLSTTLKKWPDEQVSADMANKIQKTLLDDKLREGSTMNRKSMLAFGGGVAVTVAVCLIIGGIYLKTYSQKSIEQYYQTTQQMQSTQRQLEGTAYEPYYLQSEYRVKNAADEAARRQLAAGDGVSSGVITSGPDSSRLAEQKKEVQAKASQDGFDLAADYKQDVDLLEKERAESFASKKIQSEVVSSAQPPVERKAGEAGYDLAKTYEIDARDNQAVHDKLSSAKDSARGRSSGGFQSSSYDMSGSGARVDAAAPVAGKNEIYDAGVEFWGGGQSTSNGKLAQLGAVNANQAISKSKANYGYESYPSAAPTVAQEPAYDYNGLYYDQEEADYVGNKRPVIYPNDDRLIYRQPAPTYYPYPEPNTEEYASIYENPFLTATSVPLSTFSIDVDTASYSNIRRFVEQGQLPPVDAVRIEEMINYFDYTYEKPKWGEPFSVTTNGAVCPWNQSHYLVMIGLQGNVPSQNQIPPSNLVFLIDVSGSMNHPNKLPLLKQSLKMLVDQLRPDQKVAIVTYSGSARLYLDSTSGAYKGRIHAAIDNLTAGGSTAGEAGLNLAYRVARDNFIRNGNNRVILATDGDFNVGAQNDYELTELIKQRRKDGIFLSILGFGTGNYKDSKMEKIADNGNGNYYYIDTIEEGRKVLVEELGSTLFTIAKDVKIQVEFNPQHVQAYRLIGYENRILNQEDFNNDRVDAGEIGAGHTVTALYEIIPSGTPMPGPYPVKGVDPLKYQKKSILVNNEIMTVKLRFKAPKSNQSRLLKKVVRTNELRSYASGELQFAAAVAEFGLLLRNSQYKGYANYDHVINEARKSRGIDADRHRAEFVNLVELVKQIDHRYLGYPEPYPVPQPYPVYDQNPNGYVPPVQFK